MAIRSALHPMLEREMAGLKRDLAQLKWMLAALVVVMWSIAIRVLTQGAACR